MTFSIEPARAGHWAHRAIRSVSPRSGRGWVRQGLVLAAALAAIGANAPAALAASDTVGANLPLLTSPFWQAYNNYLPQYAKQLGVDMLAPVNSPQVLHCGTSTGFSVSGAFTPLRSILV